MRKARAATLLGGLTVVGMLALSNLVGASAQSTYFAQLKGAFGRSCLQYAAQNIPEGERSIFGAACAFMASTLAELQPGDGDAEMTTALVKALAEETPGVSPLVSCEVCIQSISDFEAYLAVNGTVRRIDEALQAGCRKKYTKQPQLNECLQKVAGANTPALVDFALANVPPVTACEQMHLCP